MEANSKMVARIEAVKVTLIKLEM